MSSRFTCILKQALGTTRVTFTERAYLNGAQQPNVTCEEVEGAKI